MPLMESNSVAEHVGLSDEEVRKVKDVFERAILLKRFIEKCEEELSKCHFALTQIEIIEYLGVKSDDYFEEAETRVSSETGDEYEFY